MHLSRALIYQSACVCGSVSNQSACVCGPVPNQSACVCGSVSNQSACVCGPVPNQSAFVCCSVPNECAHPRRAVVSRGRELLLQGSLPDLCGPVSGHLGTRSVLTFVDSPLLSVNILYLAREQQRLVANSLHLSLLSIARC